MVKVVAVVIVVVVIMRRITAATVTWRRIGILLVVVGVLLLLLVRITIPNETITRIRITTQGKGLQQEEEETAGLHRHHHHWQLQPLDVMTWKTTTITTRRSVLGCRVQRLCFVVTSRIWVPPRHSWLKNAKSVNKNVWPVNKDDDNDDDKPMTNVKKL